MFFDPIGQALCKRTLNLVEKLNEKHAERMRFYLSKADEAGHESDRQVSTAGILPSAGYPRHRENRENGRKNSMSGKTQGIWKFLGKHREFGMVNL